ncbi:MAG: PBSX family phage terminase large subunit [Alphaproteobacteria bacterium]|nr:PBSX family phage terminase large subunit [Alphaproteobacteria bacterium]
MEKKRYKLFYGGRGGGKSFAFADCLLVKGRTEKLFIACVREIQESITDSVYKLLCDRISYNQFEDYKIYSDRIENIATGTKFIFKGLRDQDAQKIKSLEGVDIAWIEEAQTISRKSWEILDPTIRKDGSEIWISMNREEENDPIWKSLGAAPDDRTLVVKVNYCDNPFCPEELKTQAAKCKEQNYDDYLHVWLGEPRVQGERKLISSKDVKAAMVPKMDNSSSPLVIGVDIARYGKDKTAICWRKGRWCYKLEAHSFLDNVQVANILTGIIKEDRPHRIFLDVGGQGAGVYDILRDRGFGEIIRGINFGGKAMLEDRYANKRAEMWGEANEWLRQELPVQIPDDDELSGDLCAVEKGYDHRGRLKLEEKENVRERIGRSPDKGDAFVLTFAEPVFDVGKPSMYGNGQVTIESLFNQSNRSDIGW